MKYLILALAAFGAFTPFGSTAVAAAEIRAVFVGIDKYQWSQTNRPDADFKDLKGAVGDARRMREALRTIYALDLDVDGTGCQSANPRSITLTDACATRKAIFAAWDKQIAASAAGDTLILYFAGHGSRYLDSQVFDQAGGYNGTILPYDARQPNAPVEAEILDREIKAVIDRATAKGIDVVTIFDSCNSGTVTRDGPADGDSRWAPPRVRRGAAAPGLAQPAPEGPGGGYRVHFAAAADGEEAREVGAVGKRAGVFTTALIEVLKVMPDAAFADIATETRLRVEALGHVAQHPQAEGALTASLGKGEGRVALYDVKAADGRIWIDGGRLTGVTAGSTFAVFPTTTAARDVAAAPLATGTVGTVEAVRASLEFPAGQAPPIGAKTVARELRHAFGDQVLRVRNGAPAADQAALGDVLRKIAFVRVEEPAALAVVAAGGDYKLTGTDGVAVATLGPIAAPDFAARLENALQKVARVKLLLALRTEGAHAADTSFCVGNDLDANAFACRATNRSDGPTLKLGEKAKLIAVNRAEEARFVYVYAIDESYAVELALPDGDGVDSAVAEGRPVVGFGSPYTKGRVTFLTISSTVPIKASVLEQGGAGERDPAACSASLLAQLLCDAQRGTRDPALPSVGNWTATVTSAMVE